MQPVHSKPLEIVAAATPITISVTDRYQMYHIFVQAPVVLLGNQSIAIGAGVEPAGVTLTFVYKGGDIDLNGNAFVIYGVTITQEMLDAGFVLFVYYDGTTSFPVLSPNFETLNFISTDKLEDEVAINTAIAQAAAAAALQHTQGTDQVVDNGGPNQVTAAEIKNMLLDCFLVPVSFEASEQCNNIFYAPCNGAFTLFQSSVTRDLSGVDDANIDVQINGVSVTTAAPWDIAMSSIVDTYDVSTPTGLFTFAAGDGISLVATKTTVGGKCLATLRFTHL
jgi:hypothetical protein